MKITKLYLPEKSCVRPFLKRVKTLCTVTHYTGVPMQRVELVYRYYAEECVKQSVSASANYVVDKDVILELMPSFEVSWGCGAQQYWHYTPFAKRVMEDLAIPSPNYCTINIEVCYDDISGEFPFKCVENLVFLLKGLQREFALDPEWGHVRHWDITGKECPKYYIGRSAEWAKILSEVR